MDDLAFEQRLLSRAVASVEYPATPQLRARVVAQIAQEAPVSARTRSLSPRYALALLAAVAVAVTLTIALPASRSAVARFFHIEGSRIERLPTPESGVTPTPFASPVGIEFTAQRSSLEDATRIVRFAPRLPSSRGDPQAVYVLSYSEQPVLVLHYEDFDLWESRTVGFFQKGLTAEAIIDELEIHGGPAQWVHGGSHIVEYVNVSGTPLAGSQRTVDRNTMIWNDGRTFYRLETDLPEAQAVEILGSLQ